jgi:hypothetical protein
MRRRALEPVRAAACALVLAALALAAAGCGESGEHRAFVPGEAAREGIAVNLDGIDYEVFITRELNVFDPEDRQYYQGRPAPPGSAYYGVFLRACALPDLKEPRTASDDLTVVDIRGREYEPIPPPPSNVFAYRGERLQPGQCLPNKASATSYGPTGGSMVMFQIPVDATENRPFELEIASADSAPAKPAKVARFELDL